MRRRRSDVALRHHCKLQSRHHSCDTDDLRVCVQINGAGHQGPVSLPDLHKTFDTLAIDRQTSDAIVFAHILELCMHVSENYEMMILERCVYGGCRIMTYRELSYAAPTLNFVHSVSNVVQQFVESFFRHDLFCGPEDQDRIG